MSTRPLKPPTIEETTEDLENVKLEGGSEWETMSNLGPPGEGSVQLSVVSGESRRHSLFTEEDLLEDAESEGSKEDDDDEERKRKQEEVFVDKARAAMVVIGAKDIKDALERQKAVEISRKTPEARSAHILFHQAKFLMSQNRFKEALVFLNRALKTDAECKEWLTEKSRCYLKLLQPETALQFVDQVLRKDPNYFKALVLKGEILYSMWDLEKAMLFFVEGRRQRPDNTECIRGVHKVKMALEEIADYRVPPDKVRKKSSKNRSKSAKGRLTSTPATDCLMRRNQKHSLSSHRPSSRMSRDSEDNSMTPVTSRNTSPNSDLRPTTAFTRRRKESPSISRSQKSEVKISTEDPPSAKGKRTASNRPKTAVNRRSRSKSTSRDLEIEDIRRFVKESMSGSYKSSLRRFSGSTQKSTDRSGFSSKSVSSSMEDVSRESRPTHRSNLPNDKNRSRSHHLPKITPGTKVSVFLGQDKMFLDSLLKDKDLKRSHTAHTKRALRIAREVQNFVAEREKYWKNREKFIRYTTTEEDTLI